MGPLNQEITSPLPFLVSRGSSVKLMLWHGEYSTLNNRGEEEIGREAEEENEG